MWDALRELLPEIVFIPEQSDYSLDYATTTPLQDDWGGSPIGVNPMIKAVWPQAYNYQLMQMGVNETKTPVSDWVPLAKQARSLSLSLSLSLFLSLSLPLCLQ